MSLSLKRAVCPQRARVSGAIFNGFSVKSGAGKAHSLDCVRPAAFTAIGVFQAVFGRFRGFRYRPVNAFRTKHVILLCCVAISGCATGHTVPAVVKVPVAVPCLPAELPAKPETRTETEILAMDDFAATLTTWTERLELRAWAEKASALLSACR